MRPVTHTLKLLLILLLVAPAITSLAQARRSQAQAQAPKVPGFGFGVYIDMTKDELLADYRKPKNSNRRAWNTELSGNSGWVTWSYRDEPGSFMILMLMNGRVTGLMFTASNESSVGYDSAVGLLNMFLVKVNRNKWFDGASQSDFKLIVNDNNTYTMYVNKRRHPKN